MHTSGYLVTALLWSASSLVTAGDGACCTPGATCAPGAGCSSSMMGQPDQQYVNPHVYNKQLQINQQDAHNRLIGTAREDRAPLTCTVAQQYINPMVFNKQIQRQDQRARNGAIGTVDEDRTPTVCTMSHSSANPWVSNKVILRSQRPGPG